MAEQESRRGDAEPSRGERLERAYSSGGEGESPDAGSLAALRAALGRWREGPVAEASRGMPPRKARFETWSGLEVPDVVTPADVSVDHARSLGLPGEYPFTRGVSPTGYRGALWAPRTVIGFGTPALTNERLRATLAEGQSSPGIAFDFPTLMGYDSDAPRALGEVGMCGVAVDTLRDLEALFHDVPLDRVSPSLAVDGPAAVLLAFYVALADRRGTPRAALGGAIQNDCLKDFVAQHAWLLPPRPALRVASDVIAFCARELPNWDAVSIGGYHVREAGATAPQELGFALASGLAYLASCVARGLDLDAEPPRLSFSFDVHNDFFEEVAKLRAARRLWARLLRERYGARAAERLKLHAHARTSGASLTPQQPQNNAARVTLQALAAVLGGAQSLHANSLDETYALPGEASIALSRCTQHIIAAESGVANVADPLGGSYYVEWLTDRLEAEALAVVTKIDALGGMVAAIEQGHPQRAIAAASYQFQRQIERGERVVVGVNAYQSAGEVKSMPVVRVDESVQRTQREGLHVLKAARDPARVRAALGAVREAAVGDTNLMPPLIDAAKADCTEQELCDVLREAFGAPGEPPEL
ncbi:MAG: methylmalonyl-CoA mutase family protein [Polyangiaceae bacterium]|jgi:methylmalonyl-CoA mutase N-terminal domain/subunit|nr:methylmalonyl-CoA mutase family protein [Polyangiaceae bacterium]